MSCKLDGMHVEFLSLTVDTFANHHWTSKIICTLFSVRKTFNSAGFIQGGLVPGLQVLVGIMSRHL